MWDSTFNTIYLIVVKSTGTQRLYNIGPIIIIIIITPTYFIRPFDHLQVED